MSKKPSRAKPIGPAKASGISIDNHRDSRAPIDRTTGQGQPDGIDDDKTASATPDLLINETLAGIRSAPMGKFLATIFADRAVRQEVSTYLVQKASPERLYRIQQLRRAASIASHMGMPDPAVKDGIFAATLICDIQELMKHQILHKSCTPREQMLTIVCTALPRLDEEDPYAWVLRRIMGWGNDDEVDSEHALDVRHRIITGLATVGLISAPQRLH